MTAKHRTNKKPQEDKISNKNTPIASLLHIHTHIFTLDQLCIVHKYSIFYAFIDI